MSDNIDQYDYDLPPELGGGSLAARGKKSEESQTFWQRKRHMLLIGAGVLFFGAIIGDRLINMYGADELPATVQIQRDAGLEANGGSIAAADTIAADVDNAATAQAPIPDVVPVIDGKAVVDEAGNEIASSDKPLTIETVFGSPLVFVSTSEPLYVITEDDRRFDLGNAIDEQTTLAGVTGQNVILDKGGDLLVVDLPQFQGSNVAQ